MRNTKGEAKLKKTNPEFCDIRGLDRNSDEVTMRFEVIDRSPLGLTLKRNGRTWIFDGSEVSRESKPTRRGVTRCVVLLAGANEVTR